MTPVQKLLFEQARLWRDWLEAHHRTEPDAWLIIQRAQSSRPGLRLAEAVEEALCFGWIDSTLRPLDENTYLLRFSPRKAGSVWSSTNIKRVERLTEEDRMTPAGLAAVDAGKASGQWAAAAARERTDTIPPDLEAVLKKTDGALPAYKALSHSRKKQFIYWLQSAKRSRTRSRRIEAIARRVLEET